MERPPTEAALPLSDDKQHEGCADQNQKPRAGRCNAYLSNGSMMAVPNANSYAGRIRNQRFTASLFGGRRVHRIIKDA